jgi:mono/diheme cytochrome c family protein
MARVPGLLLTAGLVAAGLASSALAVDASSCVACHTDEAMLAKNLGASTARRSALQSGAG